MTHSRLGASSAHRWMACPGSVRLTAELPDEVGSEARLGTAAHEVAAECLRHDQEAWEHAGRAISVEGEEFVVDEEMAEAVQVYLDVVRGDIEEYLAETGGEYEIWVERAVGLRSLDPDLWGTADCAVWFREWRLLRTYDYKHGVGVVVEAERNPQLMYYAAGVLHDLVEVLEGDLSIGVAEVECVLVQPRAAHSAGPVRRYRLPREDLIQWSRETLAPAAQATREPDAPLVPGDHCRFCPAFRAAVCTAVHAEVEETAAAAESEDPPTLSTERLAELLDKARRVKSFYSKLEDAAFQRLVAGEDVPGAKLVEKRADRVWREGAEERLSGVFGDDAYERKLLTPAKAEKLKGAREIVRELAYKPSGALTLAPASDSREALPGRRVDDGVFAGTTDSSDS